MPDHLECTEVQALPRSMLSLKYGLVFHHWIGLRVTSDKKVYIYECCLKHSWCGRDVRRQTAWFYTRKRRQLNLGAAKHEYGLQETFLAFAFPALGRGYSVLVYEGPGQGRVLKQPPYMPFYPNWGDVLLPFLDYVEKNLSAYVQDGQDCPIR